MLKTIFKTNKKAKSLLRIWKLILSSFFVIIKIKNKEIVNVKY